MAFFQPITGDVDFLSGPRAAEGRDTYVPCEINVSSVMPIPDEAPGGHRTASAGKAIRKKVYVSTGNICTALHISPG